MHTLSEIVAYCDKLTASEKYDREEGVHYWSVFGLRQESGICTTSARMIAEKFGGQVFGYKIKREEGNENLIGYWCYGHDFAFIDDRYIVDWWAYHVDESPTDRVIFDTTDPSIMENLFTYYLPRDRWELVHDYSAKEVGA